MLSRRHMSSSQLNGRFACGRKDFSNKKFVRQEIDVGIVLIQTTGYCVKLVVRTHFRNVEMLLLHQHEVMKVEKQATHSLV